MLYIMRSLNYIRLCAIKTALNRGFHCPSCGGGGGAALDRKWLVTSFRRCNNCSLLFRTPTTTEEENALFYQSAYEEGTTTDLPTDAELETLKMENFASLSTSYLAYIEVIQALGARLGGHVVDFGCSWGYGSYQLKQAGFSVDSFEISKPRAVYARERLDIATVELDDICPESCDVFLSGHVIEHVTSVESMFILGEKALRPGGLFCAFTPNGSSDFRDKNPKGWHRSWGGVHPQLLDDKFVRRMRGRRAFIAATSPYPVDDLRAWDGSLKLLPMEGHELMIAFRKAKA
jgi:2-polyprenyl-3-methyl-5-hydroxy-6-metoxy-1,4-benzoquinol methylase